MSVNKESMGVLHRTLGVNIVWLMVNKGLTVSNIERGTGIYRTRVSRILQGRDDVTLTELQKIADYFEVDALDLLKIDNSKDV